MKILLSRIKRKLSLKLSLGILLFLIVVFTVSIGILFSYSRQKVRNEAMKRAELELSNMTQRVNELMNEVEVATRTALWHLNDSELSPDSLLSYVRLVVAQNPNFDGCSVSLQPYYFPKYGRYFSVYAYNTPDSVVAFIEKPYNYFDKPWYKTSAKYGKSCWVEAFLEDLEGTESKNFSDMIVSYCMPMYNKQQQLIGVISTDLSVPWLSKVMSKYKPYDNSYGIMLGGEGQYLIHPDSTKLFLHTIFSLADSSTQHDIVTLGHEMIAGHKGMMNVKLDGKPCVVLYQSLKKAPWSMAIVCYESDIFARYTKLLYILIPLLVFGLLLILLFCLNVLSVMVRPLNELTDKLSYITDGHYNEPISFSTRKDVIGRLQNSFAEMQQVLSSHISNLQQTNTETEKLNKELFEASEQSRKADEKMNEFLQDIAHQIRTPLNIVNGFAQVLRDDYENIPDKEIDKIIKTMYHNAVNISRMVNMLVEASNADKHVNVNIHEPINVKAFVEQIAADYQARLPETIDLTVDVRVKPEHTVRTNRDYLTKAINELLYNAMKFTTHGHVGLIVKSEGLKIVFMVEDTGPGISSEIRDNLFATFEKGNVFMEGLGLGLSVCRQLVRLIGGELKLDDNYTKGSRFIIMIPDQDAWVDLR